MDRDPVLARRLVDTAARAGGHASDGGILAFAESRTLPGPVRLPRDWRRETAEELADAVNYCCWGIQELHAAFEHGDPDVTDEFARYMRTLAALVGAWHALNS